MATTPNKGYELMATGTQTDNWGNVLNADVYTIIDSNLGGIVSKSLTSINVTLDPEESQNALLRLTGVLTGNVVVTTECLGFFFVENATTGSSTVTVRNSSIATSTAVPQGGRVLVFSDSSNGCRIFGTGDFPSGTRSPFNQTAAPTGWTKDTASAYNDAAIRLTTGTVSTGGTMAFSAAFDERTIARNQLPNVNITGTTSTDGDHRHRTVQTSGTNSLSSGNSMNDSVNYGNSNSYILSGSSSEPDRSRTSEDGDHNHTFSAALNGGVTQQPFDFSVKYADFIIATKN